MDSGFTNFMNNIGIMCETWWVTYKKFITMGLSHDDAIAHTKEFMAMMLAALPNNGDANGT